MQNITETQASMLLSDYANNYQCTWHPLLWAELGEARMNSVCLAAYRDTRSLVRYIRAFKSPTPR